MILPPISIQLLLKIRVTPSDAVFLKDGQLYFPRATKSISHHLTSIFLLEEWERKLTHTDRGIGKRAIIIARDQSFSAAVGVGGVAQILSSNHLNLRFSSNHLHLRCNLTKSNRVLSPVVQCDGH